MSDIPRHDFTVTVAFSTWSLFLIGLLALVVAFFVCLSKMRTRDNARGRPGVGGWLYLLTVILAFFGPLYLLGEANEVIQLLLDKQPEVADTPAFAGLVYLTWWIMAIGVLVSVVSAFVLILSRRPATVVFVMAVLWVSGPFSLALVAIGLPSTLLGVSEFSFSGLLKPLFVSIFWAAVWSLYLDNSRRVTRTYGRNGPEPA